MRKSANSNANAIHGPCILTGA